MRNDQVYVGSFNRRLFDGNAVVISVALGIRMIRVLSDEWLREQTIRPSTSGWYELVIERMARTKGGKRMVSESGASYNADVLKRVMQEVRHD